MTQSGATYNGSKRNESPSSAERCEGGFSLLGEVWEARAGLITSQPLFAGLKPACVRLLLENCEASLVEARRGDVLCMIGDAVRDAERFGCLLSGLLYHERYDGIGNCRISDVVEPGGLLGSVHQFGGENMHLTAMHFVRDSLCLFVCLETVSWESCGGDAVRAQVLENVARLQAANMRRLFAHVSQLGKRSVRQKVVAFCLNEVRERGTRSFDVPFNQQALADYLCITRPTLSIELGKLADEGLLTFYHGHVEVSPDLKTSAEVS